MEGSLRLCTYLVTSELLHHFRRGCLYRNLVTASSKNDMEKYMKEKAVPWVAVKYDHPAVNALKKQFE